MNMERYVRFAISTAVGMAYLVAKPLYDLLRQAIISGWLMPQPRLCGRADVQLHA